MITKEQIEQKITQLEQERDQLKTNLIAYEGALQMNKQWLEQVNEQSNNQSNS